MNNFNNLLGGTGEQKLTNVIFWSIIFVLFFLPLFGNPGIFQQITKNTFVRSKDNTHIGYGEHLANSIPVTVINAIPWIAFAWYLNRRVSADK